MSKSCNHVGPHDRRCYEDEFYYQGGLLGATVISNPPVWYWTTNTVICSHCYCQPAKMIGTITHKKCCHCGDTHAV